jgi:hypothetical protein
MAGMKGIGQPKQKKGAICKTDAERFTNKRAYSVY